MQLLVSKRLVSKLFIIVLFSLSLVNDYYWSGQVHLLPATGTL